MGKFVTEPKRRGRPPKGKPRGRPPRHQGERLSKNRTFRVRGGLDEKLEAAAAASERSVSEEIEFRLDQSFDRDEIIERFIGGDEGAEALQMIDGALKPFSVETKQRILKHVIAILTERGLLGSPIRGVNVPVGSMDPIMETVSVPLDDRTPESRPYEAMEIARASKSIETRRIRPDSDAQLVEHLLELVRLAERVVATIVQRKEKDQTPENVGETK
jgi:hypothetical protein